MSKRPPSEPAGEGANGSKLPRLEGTAAANGVSQGNIQISEFVPPPRDLPTLQYKEGRLAKDIIYHYRSGKTQLLVVINSEYMVGTNKQVKSRQLWGQDVYTDDSDLVAVLLHLGYYASNATAPHPLVSRFFAQLSLLPAQECYVSCFRNAVRSRGWFSKVEGCSFKVDRCWLVTRSNRQLELSPRADDAAISHPTYALTNLDRQMATRAAAGASRNKPVSEVTVLYNHVNEPWLKYSMAAIADRGLKSAGWTSARLREEALYLETARERFELSYVGTQGSDEAQLDLYNFSRCKQLLPVAAMKARGVPLPAPEVEVLAADLVWDDIQWANMSVTVRGTQYKMLRMHFMPRCKGATGTPQP